MLGRRTLQSSGLLISVLALPGWAGTHAEFVTPRDGDIVAGRTEFRFEVLAAEDVVERIDVYVDGLLIGAAKPPGFSFHWTPQVPLPDAEILAVVYGSGSLLEKLSIRTADLVFDDAIDVVEVQLFPVVQDRRGRYVGHLGRDDFEVYDQGRPIRIETFVAEPTSLTMALLVDVSESMVPKLQTVQEASVEFLDQLSQGDSVSVYSFNHALQLRVPPSTDLGRAKQSVRRLRAKGGTALYDAVAGVLLELAKVRGRKILVVFSDGRDERSLFTLNRAVEAARASEVIVYTIGAGDSKEDVAAREDLEVLARETGGEAHVIDKLKGLPRVFSAILADVRAQYMLTFRPPPEASGMRRVEVRVKQERYRVRCRSRYHLAR